MARKKYQNFVEALIGKEYESPLRKSIGSTILGTEAFIEEVTQTHIAEIEPDRNLPALQQFVSRPSPQDIISAVKDFIGDNEKLVRNASIHICHNYSGSKLREIGQHFAIGESAITEASRRFQLKMEKDKELGRMVLQIKGRLKI